MKQAYTNTIRGGGGRPLTIAAGSKKGRSKQRPPKCAYGTACTRKGCAYWHPSPSEGAYESYHEDPRSKICKPFLAGLCTYGHKCMNRHPSQHEADTVRAKYKETSCSYGDDCQTEGCLYWHPWEVAEAAEELSSAVDSLHLESAETAAAVPTYEQWLAMNCPSPPNMDENYVYTLWHYPGSGMQRDPWEVYCLMYPQSYNGTATTTSAAGLNATSSTWEPVATNALAAPQSWEPAVMQQQQNDEPKSFQEWKRKGQPYPSWFNMAYNDIDPWYDDEGVRRSLEEVYEVLYGDKAEENFSKKQHEQDVANDPTPAELAAMISTNDPQLGTSPVVQQSSKGGWASIAAKRPTPVQKANLINGVGKSYNIQHQAAVEESSASKKEPRRKTVVIPKEVWLPSTANSDCFHNYPNPMERFSAVNNHHKSYLAGVTIPHCFDSNDQEKSGNVALLDVHFQSAKTITPVLDRFLFQALKKNDEVWVVTGSGHHVAAGHQRRESGGVLFNAVKRYLEEREAEMALEFKVGKDTSRGQNKTSGGAFLVRNVSS